MATNNKNLSEFNTKEVPNAKGLSFGIVVSQWNKTITNNLYQGAFDTLVNFGVNIKDITKYEVPGSFELIFGAKKMATNNVDAIICLGSIIKGKTKHFDFICNAVTLGIKDLNIISDTPIIFGVLTDNSIQQAKDRSGGKYGNKGSDAAVTAINMAKLARI